MGIDHESRDRISKQTAQLVTAIRLMSGPFSTGDYNPRRYTPTKKPVSLVTLFQLLLVFPTFVEVSFVLTRDSKYFEHETTRATVAVCWWVLLLWMLTIFVNIYAILTNSYMMIVPNILFCVSCPLLQISVQVVLALPSYAAFIVLVSYDGVVSFSVLASFVECVLVTGTIYWETVAFIQMKEILG